MDTARLHIVTGAPGAGKSTALRAFLDLRTGHVAFDIDWLAGPASDLAGRSIYFDNSTWPPYNRLWFEILHGVHRNGRVPVLFAPLDDRDVASSGIPTWCERVEWLLLDCADDVRTARLASRGWDGDRIRGALDDANTLRQLPVNRLDTQRHNPGDVARQIANWLV